MQGWACGRCGYFFRPLDVVRDFPSRAHFSGEFAEEQHGGPQLRVAFRPRLGVGVGDDCDCVAVAVLVVLEVLLLRAVRPAGGACIACA